MSDRMEWFPWYAGNFLTSRKMLLMSDANVGRYVKLLSESWLHGPLPKDMRVMGRLIGLDAAEMAEAWKEIGPAFVETPKGYVNKRLEAVRQEQSARLERRRMAGKRGAQVRWTQPDNGNAIATAEQPQSDTNGNIEVEKKVEGEKEQRVKTTEGRKRKRPLPDDWEPKESHLTLANKLGVVVSREVDGFRDHALANGRLMLDWDRAFNTWLRNAKKFDRSAKPVVNEKPRDNGARGNGPARLTVSAGGAADPVDLEIERVRRWEREAPQSAVAKLRQEAADAIAAEPETEALVKALGPSAVAGKVEARYRRLVLELIARAA